MNQKTLRPWLNILALVATVVVNALANILPFNGQTTGQISDRFQVFFVPAGYVFSIWSVIYLALLAFIVYQVLPGQRENPRLGRVGYLFVLSCLANMAWLFLWHYEVFALSLLAMAALLACLIGVYLRLEIGRARVPTAERWFVHVPFSIYLGWITVATIANATSLLDYLRWNGWGISPEAWTVIMLAAVVAIALAMSLTRGDVAYLLVLIWALAGIAVKHVATPVVAVSAWVATGLVALMLVLGAILFRGRLTEGR